MTVIFERGDLHTLTTSENILVGMEKAAGLGMNRSKKSTQVALIIHSENGVKLKAYQLVLSHPNIEACL